MLNVNFSIVYTIINLLILYFFLKKFLFGRVNAVLAARKEEAERGNLEAAAREEEAEKVKLEYEAKVKELEKSRAEELRKAREEGVAEYNQIVENAGKEAKKILSDAHEAAAREREREKRALEEEFHDLIVDAASRIAGERHTGQGDRALFDRFIEEAGEKK